ncbi:MULTISPECIES: hypothetical protein [Aeromonas]|uniref:hypothetical protein n=1 Tax=Aeromonas TaxID=642 RepID=UPI001CBC8866|nr:hypothetical protein [Aeromonas enteropelogenes]UAK71243.1 hypothetical protein K8O95_16465 [Aeromonas enteropelogenes]
MIRLRLTNEYLAGPIFCPDADVMGHIDVNELPLSKDLKDKITAWDSEYQATFNNDYPPDSGFSLPEMERRHIAEGQQLAKRLQLELGRGYKVDYCP